MFSKENDLQKFLSQTSQDWLNALIWINKEANK